MNPQDANSLRTIYSKEKPLIALVILMTVMYSVLSIFRHLHFGSNTWDLGLFDQMVWHYSRFEAPGSTTRLLQNSLGDHFSPILALCAPFYWVYPHAETLLVLQAGLFALALIPLYLFCEKKIGRFQAYLLSLSFIFFWGVQHTTEYDFHADVFAVPLIAFSIYFIDVKKWVWASLSILTLLFVKEDLTLLVSAFGVYLTFHRKVKLGFSFFLIGILFFYLEVAVLIPHFNSADASYDHWIYKDLGAGPSESIKSILKNPLLPFEVLFSNRDRIKTLFFLFGPFLFFPLFSGWMILMVPLIAAKLLAFSPDYWGMSFHYSATLCPVLVMACADGLARWRQKPLFKIELSKNFSAPFLILLINFALIPVLSPWKGIEHARFWQFNDMEKTGALALALIPPGASVATQSSIAPHLSHRQTIYSLGSNADCGAIHPDFFVVCSGLGCWPIKFLEIQSCLNEKMKQGYQKIFESNGWMVLENESYGRSAQPLAEPDP